MKWSASEAQIDAGSGATLSQLGPLNFDDEAFALSLRPYLTSSVIPIVLF